MTELYTGILALTLPPILIGYLLFRRRMPIFGFIVALVLVGTGYLVVTGAVTDIGRGVLGLAGKDAARTLPAAVPAR